VIQEKATLEAKLAEVEAAAKKAQDASSGLQSTIDSLEKDKKAAVATEEKPAEDGVEGVA
jgi:hypothetical protein